MTLVTQRDTDLHPTSPPFLLPKETRGLRRAGRWTLFSQPVRRIPKILRYPLYKLRIINAGFGDWRIRELVNWGLGFVVHRRMRSLDCARDAGGGFLPKLTQFFDAERTDF